MVTAAQILVMIQTVVEAHPTHNTFYSIWSPAKDAESEPTYPCVIEHRYIGRVIEDVNGTMHRSQLVQLLVVTSVATDRTVAQRAAAVHAADTAAIDIVLGLKAAYSDYIEVGNVTMTPEWDERATLETGVLLTFTVKSIAGACVVADPGELPSLVPASFTLGDLSDVDTTGVATGNALLFDGTNWGPGTVSGGGGGVTDHGALTGLSDDDHPQYLNNARGDARYDALGAASAAQTAAATDATTKANAAQSAAATDATTKANAAQAAAISTASSDATTKASAALAAAIAASAPASHTHAISDVTGLQTALDGKQASGSYAAASHTHTASEVTDFNAVGDARWAALAPVSLLNYTGGSIATTSTSLADIHASAALTASEVGFYEFEFFLTYNAAATTTGAFFSINGTAVSDYFTADLGYSVLSTDRGNYQIGTFNGGIPMSSSVVTTGNNCLIQGKINVTTPGTILPRFATEINASAITVTAIKGFLRKLS